MQLNVTRLVVVPSGSIMLVKYSVMKLNCWLTNSIVNLFAIIFLMQVKEGGWQKISEVDNDLYYEGYQAKKMALPKDFK